MKKISKEYIAGIADSDGSFSYIKKFNKQRKKYYYGGAFQLTWKYHKNSVYVFEQLKNKYGGSYFIGITKKNCKIIKYMATGCALSKLCNDIFKFLIIKKEQALITIDGAKIKYKRWGVKGKPKEIWDKEIALYKKANKLNNKNKKIWYG